MRSGRVVHIVRRRAERLDAVLDVIATTLDIHIRIDETVRHILGRLQIGNSYVNRGVIVLSVGVQPSAAKGCPAPAQGPRPALPAPLRDRAHHVDRHYRRGRQRQPSVVTGRRVAPL